ncbi:MAG: Tetrahydromethanopterin:alpha-L-glutamate ligase [Candidatus Lokiarchaeum sp. GC14_75]|nr:MAG: Tetrahydromethanopterin:alpha-L-glutamate ligase [Candidatus Lokiarchaeum sp. GC14_75]
MHSMIITPNPSDPEVQLLSKEFEKRGFRVEYFIPSQMIVKVSFEDKFKTQFENLEPKAALVRGFGAGIFQKIFFRLDILRAIEECDVKLINSRESLEIASDKFLTSIFLEKHKIPTPKTIICEDPNKALDAFEEMGADCVYKPLFGSKGVGITRLNDRAFAENVIYTLGRLNKVFYLQEFIEHYNRDIRILVLGDKAIAGMYRVGDNWKTNIYAGAKAKPLEISDELKNLAVKTAQITKAEIAGVDIIESERGYLVLEVNSIPGFTALQKVTDINIAEEIINFFLKRANI